VPSAAGAINALSSMLAHMVLMLFMISPFI